MAVLQGVKPMGEYESLMISPSGLGPSDGGAGSHTRAYELRIRSTVRLQEYVTCYNRVYGSSATSNVLWPLLWPLVESYYLCPDNLLSYTGEYKFQ